jgi:hypothetical protein
MAIAQKDMEPVLSYNLDWRGLFGITAIQTDLNKLLISPTMHPVLLLHGPSGLGKSRLALWCAAVFLCEARTGCGQCANCKEVLAGFHPDVLVLHQQEGESIKTSEVTGLQENLSTLSSSGFRIALITDCDRFTPEAANRLLKSLEEPDSQTRFILTTSRPKALPPTILGRCLKYKVKPPAMDALLTWSQEIQPRDGAIALEDPELKALILRLGRSPGKIKNYFDSIDGAESSLEGCVDSVLNANNPAEVIRNSEVLVKTYRLTIENFLALCEWSLNKMYKQGAESTTLLVKGQRSFNKDVTVIAQRRSLLKRYRNLAVAKRIHLNTQLVAESIGLIPFTKYNKDLSWHI